IREGQHHAAGAHAHAAGDRRQRRGEGSGRAGSVVLPLADPLRVVEEWAVVDNLSGGRVDVAFASGWNPNDFVLAPDVYPRLRETWLERVPEVRRLWRGGEAERVNGRGETVRLRPYPPPVQRELPVWLAVSRRAESFVDAGRLGCHVLTMLQGSNLQQLAGKITAYREARRAAGLDPAAGRVTLMLHTFVDPDEARARAVVREPFLAYIRSSVDAHLGAVEGAAALGEEERRRLAEFSFERYCREASLIGTPESCLAMIRACHAAGVDEVACLIDFGAPRADVLASLPHLAALRARLAEEMPAAAAPEVGPVTPPEPALPAAPSAQPAAADVPPADAAGLAAAEAALDIQPRTLVPAWTEAPTEANPLPAGPVLILGAGPLAAALATLHPGARQVDPTEPGLAAGEAAAWDRVVAGAVPGRLYLLADAPPEPGADEVARGAAGQERGPLALLRLAQALARADAWRPGLQLRVVTVGCWAAADADEVTPYAAGVAGLLSALGKETPGLDLAHVDLPPGLAGAPGGLAAAAAAVATEPAQRPGERVAWRAGRRLRQELRLAMEPAPERVPYRPGGVYLIVGGAGQVGRALSRHLAATCGARLVWVGRRPEDAAIAAARAEIQSLGGELTYHAAASEDAAALRAIVAETVARHGALHGAFHAALVFQDERTLTLAEARAREILDAKTAGTAALFEAIRPHAPDFLLLLGSAQSFFNEARRGAYAAACCLQDALAARLRAVAAFPVHLINWGFWAHGLDPAHLPALRAAGLGAITPADGLPAITACLAAEAGQRVYLRASPAALTRMGVGGETPVARSVALATAAAPAGGLAPAAR
ncbi:MAG: MupA/Atu3671 family FMN-dependent luciferase-like monooxygenase, partial [Opitutaceae bacterium]